MWQKPFYDMSTSISSNYIKIETDQLKPWITDTGNRNDYKSPRKITPLRLIFKHTSKEQHNNVAILTTLILRNLNVRWQRHCSQTSIIPLFQTQNWMTSSTVASGAPLAVDECKKVIESSPLVLSGFKLVLLAATNTC